jgi:hypothetical protein
VSLIPPETVPIALFSTRTSKTTRRTRLDPSLPNTRPRWAQANIRQQPASRRRLPDCRPPRLSNKTTSLLDCPLTRRQLAVLLKRDRRTIPPLTIPGHRRPGQTVLFLSLHQTFPVEQVRSVMSPVQRPLRICWMQITSPSRKVTRRRAFWDSNMSIILLAVRDVALRSFVDILISHGSDVGFIG